MKSVSLPLVVRLFPRVNSLARAVILTFAPLLMSSCSHLSSPGEDPYLQQRYGDSCKSHAYVRSILADHISGRFGSGTPVRMAIIPFSAPANLTAVSNEQPGLGNVLAWQLQSRYLQTQAIPIVEVFNRPDWPGKREEFFSGNFGALQFAREAGYDLVMVGHFESMRDRDSMAVFSKILETDSGITLWYAKTEASTGARRVDRALDFAWVIDRKPADMYVAELVNQLSRCMVRDSVSERMIAE